MKDEMGRGERAKESGGVARRIRACGRPVRDYACEWTGSGFAGMEEFGRRVLQDRWSGVLRDERCVSKDIWHQVLDSFSSEVLAFTKRACILRWVNIVPGKS